MGLGIMLSVRKHALPGAVLVSVVWGAGMAAEPIFVTPPSVVEIEKPQLPGAPKSALDDLPVAKTVPVDRIQTRPDGKDLPVFVQPEQRIKTVVSPPEAVDEPPPRAMQETKTAVKETSAASEALPDKGNAAKDADIPDAEISAAFIKPAVAPVTDGVPETEIGVDLGLGLEPIKVRKKLPAELDLLQTKLANIVSSTDVLPEKEGLRRLCSETVSIKALVQTLSRAPLMEVTTHFTLWRSAMGELQGSIASLQQSCKKPSGKAVDQFRKVVKRFSTLVDSR